MIYVLSGTWWNGTGTAFDPPNTVPMRAGTFVTHRPRLRNNLDVNFGVTDLIRSMGMEPGTEGLKVYEASASTEEARLLSLPNAAPVLCVERTRTADGRPVVFSLDLVPVALVEGRGNLLPQLGQRSIYELLDRDLGITVRQGVVTIRPAKADRSLAAALRGAGRPRREESL
jgi:GntR family transcriptional regulator